MMKRLFAAALLALSSIAFGATLVPVQLINPAGSTAGQAIISTGPTTAPTFGTVPLTGITGTLAIANGGTGATSASAARTNLGLGTAATANTGTSGSVVPLLNGANTWGAAQVFSALVTPSSTVGIKGTATNDSAQAGSIGEFPTPSNLTGVSLTSGTPANLASVSLAAGDWDVECTATFNPAATPSVIVAGVNTTSVTLPASIGSYNLLQVSFPSAAQQVISSPRVRLSLASTTTAFCIGQSTFASTMTAGGFIRARRVR